MSAEIRRLNEERGRVVAEMRDLLERSKVEKRALNTEEQSSYDQLFERQESLKGSIEREQKQAEIEHEMRIGRGDVKTAQFESVSGESKERDEFVKKAFRSFLKGGFGSLREEEVRALSAGNHVEGGAVVAPQTFVAEVLKAVDDRVIIRQLATKFTLDRPLSLGIPVLDSDPADADWTSELGTGSEDASMKFGSRELVPHPLAKRIKLSNKLIRSSIVPIEALVQERLAYKFAVTEEKALLTGSGANQPLGLFTAHASGVPTSRDVVGSNTTTAIVADTLFDVKYAVKEQYQASGAWLFHRDAVKAIMKLKDNQNQYLWQPGLQSGQPDTLLSRPVYQSEYVPNTFTTGKYVGMFGDFSKVWIVDALDMTVQKLVELYAETNQTGYVARMEMDGMPVLAEAFARVKLA
jgi:HK97 family phage major capsid protein